MVVALYNKSCPCEWVRAARDADVLGALPASTHLPHRVIAVRATRWAIITPDWHTQQGRCLEVNTVQILALLTSKLERADNKAHPGEPPHSLHRDGGQGSLGVW